MASLATDSASVTYRVVVRSAPEAVALVRSRFGERARVLSVRQLEAGGLARFLRAPRLEVIVAVGEPSPAARLELRSDETAAPDAAEGEASAPAAPPAPRVHAPGSILKATGLDDVVIERIRADHPGIDWDALRAPEALARLAVWLRAAADGLPARPAGPRRVLIGPCGAGKTTALCKMLSLEVFVRGRQAAVLKLDGELPNASDGLAAFCDVLGAPLLRTAGEIGEFDDDSLVFVDLPGLALDAAAEQARLAQTLDALRVDTRVLVVNAAWESEVIAEAYAMGRACCATHVFFTHCDETRRPAKLWRFVLAGGLRPVGWSSGPSPAGEIEEDWFNALLSRTVPAGFVHAPAPEGGRR